uniref:uncharacterized protein LOC101297793 n=1 Tax=Fragaria vesca subsp. vesca TaxID=101020 RepID=UPI0005CAB8BE|nr:PREDICTED: uncharacterized protein LOC101297793 [Fragaria vesca subsp. vesca]XP_011458195.1 PREDICTED: uncharacterized protein LOC101297793 [Fragaria vesca subsp. vesca]
MAECLASPLCVKLQMQRSFAGGKPRSSQSKIAQRKHSYGNCKTVPFPMWKTCDFTPPGFSNSKVSPFSGEAGLKCSCLGTLIGSDGATASDWVPIVDQVLLTASVFLTYMAGVIPGYNSSPPFQKNINDNAVPKASNASGSARKNNDPDSGYPIDAVKKKLSDSLEALELGDNLGNRVLEPEGYYAKRPLSLNAIADGPRLRLLWTSLQRIEEEVKSISNSQTVNSGYCLADFSGVIQNSCLPVCTSWLETELDLLSSKPNKALVLLMDAKLNGDNAILQNIRNSGKEDLYAELLYFLSFGSLREGCSYDSGLFMIHGVSILEDLVITLSDGIVSIYLELISVDSNFSDEMDGMSLALCPLSTRALQRLRNEVALYQWLYQNLEAVASMYEDRFDLWTFESQLIKKADNSWNENYSWWKRLIHKKSDTASSTLDHVLINNFSMPVKRTKELRALTGWRYYFSLFLELSDISMPLVRAVIDKVSKAMSFFLVCLIGRSLGLIYTGIRQSLRWK